MAEQEQKPKDEKNQKPKDSLFQRLFNKVMDKKKKLKPKIKLNPEHSTGKAILERRKKLKEILDNS